MVVGQDDAGLVGNASLLQPLHQVLQCVFQLQIAGNVRLHRLRIGQIFHRVAVFGAHGVVPVVLVVTAEGHVIGVEGFSAVDVVAHGGLHHLQIGGGPVDLHGQTGIRRLECVAHVGVGDVPVVEIPDVVVIAPGLIAHALERIAQAERQIVGARHIEAGIRLRAGHIRIKPHAHGVFAVGGDGLERAVVIFKENTRMAQLVERRRQLLADKPRAEALGADGDEVIVLKKSCVVVFAGGCCICQILVCGLENIAVGTVCKSRKIDAFDHVIGVAAVCPRNIAYIQGRRRDHNAAAAAEEHVSKLLRRGGQHADFFVAAVSGGVHIGKGMIDGEGFIPSGVHKSRDRQQQCEEHGKGGHSLFPAQPKPQRLRPPQDKAEDHGNQRQQEEQDLQQILADPIEKLRVEIDDHISAHADLADGHEISEDAMIDQLHLGQHHLCCHQ